MQQLILLLTYKKWIKVDNNYDCVGLGLFNRQILSNVKHFSLSHTIIFIYSSFLYNIQGFDLRANDHVYPGDFSIFQ